MTVFSEIKKYELIPFLFSTNYIYEYTKYEKKFIDRSGV